MALGAGICLLAASTVVRAQGVDAAQAEELARRLDRIERILRGEIETLRKQVAEQNEEIARLRQAAPVPPPTAPSPAAQPATPARAVEISGAAQQETFTRDRDSVARVDNEPLDPALQGFFGIPGTPARLKVDGYAKFDFIFDPTPAGNADQFVPNSIPIGLSDATRTATTNLHVRQTRVNLDFRSPTELAGTFRTYAEIDFFGSDGSVDPRMRHFYGQLKNILVGQTWTTYTDVDAFPDTLDFAGPAGIAYTRQAQLRYTLPVAAGQNLALSIERPVTQAPALGETGTAYTPAPDVIARYRFERGRGHLQVGSVFRTLGYRIETANTRKLGIGVNLSGAYLLPGDDVVMGYVTVGRGIARYVDELGGLNGDLDLDDDGRSITALPVLAGYAAYTHHWTPSLRSTGVFGYSGIDNTAGQLPTAFNEAYYVSANVIWNVIGSLNLGLEYLYGAHRQNDGLDEDASRLQFAAKYDFFRKRPIEGR